VDKIVKFPFERYFKQVHKKILLKNFHLNGHTLALVPQHRAPRTPATQARITLNKAKLFDFTKDQVFFNCFWFKFEKPISALHFYRAYSNEAQPVAGSNNS